MGSAPQTPNFLLFPQVRAERQKGKCKILTGKEKEGKRKKKNPTTQKIQKVMEVKQR